MSITDSKPDRLSAFGFLYSRITLLLGVVEEAERNLQKMKKLKLQRIKELSLFRVRTTTMASTSQAKANEVRKNKLSAETESKRGLGERKIRRVGNCIRIHMYIYTIT